MKAEMNYLKGVIKEQELRKSVIEFDESQLIDLSKMAANLTIRIDGNLQAKAFHLSTFYNWIIVKDDQKQLCLVPLRKEGD